MARYQDAVCRLCRREGMKLYLKGERCFKEKCSFETRKGKIPGQHGAAKAKKPTGYALQLREKQKVKRIYGVLEKQFRLYFERAESKKGVTGHNLLSFLESRLDNVVFRLGFAPSRAAARQMVMHGHILVNGKRCDIPSYQTKSGQSIEISVKAQANDFVKSSLETAAGRGIPQWLTLDAGAFKGSVIAVPKREDVPLDINEQLIVELYSK
ncbi:30S ribosomal protein S4 [Mesoterricola silvestris]|uniref:Small ribosomal subunit protein uS4 n=1 Tax=Mesoterricola silvestris TaxID=2927979 RepID=A0AA48GVK1_9BACT|nr:30S ribosomal protein S4 [Mesoterricola silvestris]BDU71128.1 30S ribosomal protein S4 [Mesoterricola silvestris]